MPKLKLGVFSRQVLLIVWVGVELGCAPVGLEGGLLAAIGALIGPTLWILMLSSASSNLPWMLC